VEPDETIAAAIMAEIVPIDRLLRKRRSASACAHYAALSEAEVEALSTSELIQAHFATLPELTAYGRAWYQQRAKQFRQYRKMSFKQLVNVSFNLLLEADKSGGKLSKKAVLVLLEMDRRAQRDGYVTIGEWLEATFRDIAQRRTS
jgi:hypothetical protein